MSNYKVSGFAGANSLTAARTSMAAVVLSAAIVGGIPQIHSTHNYKTTSTLSKEGGTPSAAVLKEEFRSDMASGGFEADVAAFYERLQKSQEPLGPDFERVLFDNLWDLYADA